MYVPLIFVQATVMDILSYKHSASNGTKLGDITLTTNEIPTSARNDVVRSSVDIH